MEIIYTKKATLADRSARVTTSEMINQYGNEFQHMSLDDQFRAMWLEGARRVALSPEVRASDNPVKYFGEQIEKLINARTSDTP